MHILIGIILILLLLAISKTLRTLALIGGSIIVGVVVISMAVAAMANTHDAISIIGLLLVAGAALIIWIMIKMGMHLGSVAGGSVDEYVDSRLKGKKHDESLKAARNKAVDLLVEDATQLDNSHWGSNALSSVYKIQDSQITLEPDKEILTAEELIDDEVESLDGAPHCHIQEHNTEQEANRLWRVLGRRNAEVLDHTAKPNDIAELYNQYFWFSERNGCCIKCRQPLYIFQAKDFCAPFGDLTPEWKVHSCDLKPTASRGEWQLFLPLAYPTGVTRGRLQSGVNQEELVINYETASPHYWPNYWCGEPMLASSENDYYRLSTFVFIEGEIVPIVVSGRRL